jgi:chemotaxis signal transduction protein
MIGADVHISDRAAELRRAFDNSFVDVQHFESVATEDFLSVNVGGDPYVLRLGEVAGLFADKKVTRLPSGVAELSGVAGFRGAIVPVYDLAALLRYPASQSARWMVIAAEAPIALAFNSFDGHCRFAANAVAVRDGAGTGGHLDKIVRSDDFVRPIINIPSIVAAVRALRPIAGARKEH